MVDVVGVHHIGFTVSDLEASAAFFTELLGWKERKRKPDYPAIFVGNQHLLLTLWAAQVDQPLPFDRKSNIGLHHLALQVESEDALQTLYLQLRAAGVKIEFAPEPLGDGPAKHMMCYEPSGIRVEFIHAPS